MSFDFSEGLYPLTTTDPVFLKIRTARGIRYFVLIPTSGLGFFEARQNHKKNLLKNDDFDWEHSK